MERTWAERREIETFLPHGLPPPLLFLPPAVPGSPRTPEWRERWPKKGGGLPPCRGWSPLPQHCRPREGEQDSLVFFPVQHLLLILLLHDSTPHPGSPSTTSRKRGEGRGGGREEGRTPRSGGKGRRDRGRKGRIRGGRRPRLSKEVAESRRRKRRVVVVVASPPSTFSKAKSLLCSPSLFPFLSFLPLLPRPLLSNSLLSGKGKKAPLEALKERKRWVGLSPISSLFPRCICCCCCFPLLHSLHLLSRLVPNKGCNTCWLY